MHNLEETKQTLLAEIAMYRAYERTTVAQDDRISAIYSTLLAIETYETKGVAIRTTLEACIAEDTQWLAGEKNHRTAQARMFLRRIAEVKKMMYIVHV